jgi:hypothetical protein
VIADEGRDADGLLWLTHFFISEKNQERNLFPFLFCYFSIPFSSFLRGVLFLFDPVSYKSGTVFLNDR